MSSLRLFRLQQLLLTLVATGLLFIEYSSLAGAAERPNVVFILADDLGYSDLGCYGGEINTPNLDQLAAGGLRFRQFYNTARCWPSRAVLLSGYYAQQIRRDKFQDEKKAGTQGVRPAWAPLLPELLGTHGYRSYHSGKWHIDGRPLKSGFTHSYEIGSGQNNYFSSKGITEDETPISGSPDFYVTSGIGDHAVKTLQDHARNHAEQPFFHYICFTAPHFPLQAPENVVARYREQYQRGWNLIQKDRDQRLRKLGLLTHPLPAMEQDVGPPYDFPAAFKILGPGEVNRPIAWDVLTAEQCEFQAAKMAVHAAMIDSMDREIGRVVQQLRYMKALDNTVLFFASDNGASAEIMVRGDGHDPQALPGSGKTYLCLGPGWSSAANTPLRRHKTWVHEGGIGTPFIVHWPQGIKARGEVRHEPGHLIDIVPTILDLAGVPQPEKWNGQPCPRQPGVSLRAHFAGHSVPLRELWWLHEGNRALRLGDWKIVATKSKDWELYDLSTDRGETQNLASARPEKVRELADLWEARTTEFRRHAAE